MSAMSSMSFTAITIVLELVMVMVMRGSGFERSVGGAWWWHVRASTL